MAAVTVHSQLRNLSLGDQHFNYPLPLKKKKKEDTLIYPSDWLDSCQSDNLSVRGDLVLVLGLLCVHPVVGLLWKWQPGSWAAPPLHPSRPRPPTPAPRSLQA